MLLVLHIISALTSLGLTTLNMVYPSAKRQQTANVLIASTLTTGTYLVYLHPATLKQSCISGLVFICVSLVEAAIARKRLSTIQISN